MARKLVHAVTVSVRAVERHILLIRGERVMLDRDLATLYAVTTSD